MRTVDNPNNISDISDISDNNKEILQHFRDLYDNNKYLIKIYNTDHNNWYIYMFKNHHIQVDIQTPTSLSSKYIDVEKIVEYIDNEESDIKISYTCYYDDFEEYKNKLQSILEKIKQFYEKRGKTILIKYKVYWN